LAIRFNFKKGATAINAASFLPPAPITNSKFPPKEILSVIKTFACNPPPE